MYTLVFKWRQNNIPHKELWLFPSPISFSAKIVAVVIVVVVIALAVVVT